MKLIVKKCNYLLENIKIIETPRVKLLSGKMKYASAHNKLTKTPLKVKIVNPGQLSN